MPAIFRARPVFRAASHRLGPPVQHMHQPAVSHTSMANAIRALSMDAVEQAKSGHPGMPMGMADVATVLFSQFLKFDAADPTWPDRDRFVLSAGHGSMLLYASLYLLGGETDIAYANGMDDVRRIRHVPAYVGNLIGAGHGGSYWQPNGGKAAAAVVAWLDWQLRGDRHAAKHFVGKDCGLCRDPAWQFSAAPGN